MLWWRFYYEICSCSLIATEAIELAGEQYRGTTMIKRLSVVLIASLLLVNFAQANEKIDLKDGKVHDIKKVAGISCTIRVDYLHKGEPTTLNFTSKEQHSHFIEAYQESIVNMDNAVCHSIVGHDNSTIKVYDSEILLTSAYNSSVLNLTNSAFYEVCLVDDAKANIKDCRIKRLSTQSRVPVAVTSGRFDSLVASDNGQIIIIGSDFKFDDVPTKLTKISLANVKQAEEHTLSFILENKYKVLAKIALYDKGSIVLEQIKDKTEVKPK